MASRDGGVTSQSQTAHRAVATAANRVLRLGFACGHEVAN